MYNRTHVHMYNYVQTRYFIFKYKNNDLLSNYILYKYTCGTVQMYTIIVIKTRLYKRLLNICCTLPHIYKYKITHFILRLFFI